MDQITMLDAALKYAELGLSVVPLRRDKTPYVKWERHQKQAATPDEIRKWWKKWPDANIGIATGPLSGIFVIDFDSADALQKCEAQYDEMPVGPFYTTGRGRQYWFLWQSYGQGNKTGIMKHVDLRGEGGYVMVPPSVHENGKTYTWGNINPLIDGLDELTDCPEELLKFCRAANKTPGDLPPDPPPPSDGSKPTTVLRPSRETLEWVQDILMNGAAEGARNATAAKLCGWMVRQRAGEGMTKEQMLPVVEQAMMEWNVNRNRPPLAAAEIRKTCASIINRHSFVAMEDAIGSPIYQIECIRRKVGGSIYKVYADHDKAIQCSIHELLTLAIFREKYADLTDNVIPTMKNDRWFKLVEACLRDKIEWDENLFESPVSMLASWIKNTAEKSNGERAKLNNCAVVIDELVHVAPEAAVTHMQTTCHVKANWDEVRAMLKALGFYWDKKRSGVRVGQNKVHTWRMEWKLFIKNNNMDSEDAVDA